MRWEERLETLEIMSVLILKRVESLVFRRKETGEVREGKENLRDGGIVSVGNDWDSIDVANQGISECVSHRIFANARKTPAISFDPNVTDSRLCCSPIHTSGTTCQVASIANTILPKL